VYIGSLDSAHQIAPMITGFLQQDRAASLRLTNRPPAS
jgi:hypothetical protein